MTFLSDKIIKANEICNGIQDKHCIECPYYKISDDDCVVVLAKDTVKLINHQKAENSNLYSCLTSLQKDLISLQKDLTSSKAEIERLKKEIKKCKEHYKMACTERNEFLEQLETAKSEAIKEFAERLKAVPVRFHITHEHLDKFVPFIDDVDIDNLVKEMVGVNNE